MTLKTANVYLGSKKESYSGIDEYSDYPRRVPAPDVDVTGSVYKSPFLYGTEVDLTLVIVRPFCFLNNGEVCS